MPIVAATGMAIAPYTAKEIESVMSAAMEQAAAEGVTDPNEVRRRMLEARKAFKDSARAALGEMAAISAEGITDPEQIRARMLEARKRAKP
jgi:hypothetical protein